MKFTIFYALFVMFCGGIFCYKSLATEQKPETLVFVITNVKEKGHFGDRSQSMGIKYYLVKTLKANGIRAQIKEIDIHDIKSLRLEIKKAEAKSIIISAGDYGIEALSSLKKDKAISPKIMTIWSGHQEFQYLQSALPFLDVVVLPEYLISTNLKEKAFKNGSNLIAVDFISHSLSLKNVELAYEKFQYKDQILLNKPYVILLFGGDAPDSEGKMLAIKDSEITQMATDISRIIKANKSTLVIANSYRTKEVQQNLLFDTLRSLGIKDYIFFDFHKNVQSYKPLLYLISRGNVAIVTGESVSMIDEAVQFSKKPVYVQKVSSMNINHVKHLDFLKKADYVMELSEYKETNLYYKKPSFSAKTIVMKIKKEVLLFLGVK